MHHIINRLRGGARGPWILASSVVVALLVTPFALAAGEGRPLLAGKRNPSPNASVALSAETQVIANTSTYGTRQSNKSDNGGGAVYGCRSKAGGIERGNEPCLRSRNQVDGRAFEFENTGGSEVGVIRSSNPSAAPFTTNAGGVATGLNADQVDGQSAAEIVAAAQAPLPVTRFAAVNGATGALAARRGASAASRTATGTYTVTFDGDVVSLCAYSATVIGGDTQIGFATVESVDATTLRVHTRQAAGDSPAADRSFHLIATCSPAPPPNR
jgi:hypothetical protein